LEFEPAKSDVIDILDKNSEAYSWTKQGLDIHSKDDNCIFCGNLVTETRYKFLTKYFQNQASKLREEISDIFKLISIEEASIEAINTPLSVNDFNTGHQEAYEKHKTQLTKEITKYKKLLNRIKTSLTKKIELNIYSSITVPFLANGIDKLKEKIQEINDVIKSNNEFVDNFDEIIENEREKYKSHLVAKFLKKSKYLTKKGQHACIR